mgnify:CR=1 FL=1
MKIRSGYLYFYIHLAIEIVSFYIISSYFPNGDAELGVYSILYDFIAFVPQGIFGILLDENKKFHPLIIGVSLATISLILLMFNSPFLLTIISIGLGNALIHISGAERTLKDGNGQMTPVALFVGGGSFGVILGKIFFEYEVNIVFVFIILLSILIAAIFLPKDDKQNVSKKPNFDYSNKNINPILIIVLAVFVVIIRSYIGYGIPTSWNKKLYQSILLYVFMGLGKCLGGILIDRIGIKWTSLISTIGSIPFLVFGDKIMFVSIIGVMLFSMTMAITLGGIVSAIPRNPGIAFGVTTIGLLLGTVPTFYVPMPGRNVCNILIVVMSLLAAVGIWYCMPVGKRGGNK